MKASYKFKDSEGLLMELKPAACGNFLSGVADVAIESFTESKIAIVITLMDDNMIISGVAVNDKAKGEIDLNDLLRNVVPKHIEGIARTMRNNPPKMGHPDEGALNG